MADICRAEVPTAPPEETVRSIRDRLPAGWTWLAVVNPAGTVLGRVRRSRLGDDPEASAGDLMDLGPSTYRLSVALSEIVPKMKTSGFERALVTDPDGKLRGFFTRADGEAQLSAT